MALIKTISNGNTGIDLTYWRVTGINVCFVSNMSQITVSGYKTKQDRLDGKSPIKSITMSYYSNNNPISKSSIDNGDALAAAYLKLKEPSAAFMPANPFVGAQDD